MVAAKKGPRSLVRRLIELGADVRAENTRGGTALMYAAISGDPAVLAALLDQGARIDHCASNGWSALTIAAAKGRTEAVALLLARGADPNLADIYGGTPLIRAVEGGYEETVRALLQGSRVAVDAEDEAGATALHHAAAQGDPALVRLLVRHGADTSHRTGRGLTPLDVARMQGRTAAASELAARPGDSSG
jgi:ankyrin repeat protein